MTPSVTQPKEGEAVERVLEALQARDQRRDHAKEDLIALCEEFGYATVIRWATNAGRCVGRL